MATMEAIQKQFALVGARVKIGDAPRNDNNFTINVGNDKKGEFFDLQVRSNIELMVQDTQRSDRHLLLIAKTPGAHKHFDVKERFLCGHDERHWFCATIPTSVTTVVGAKQALKPAEIVELETRAGVRTKNAHRRHKKLGSMTMHRQGEFFFVPAPGFRPDERLVLKNERMSGGGGHAHTAQFLYRSGGESVWVKGFGRIDQQVLSISEYNRLPKKERAQFTAQRADATVYVKGKVSHIEHATVHLGDVWHRVHVNTEQRSRSRSGGSNRFLD